MVWSRDLPAPPDDIEVTEAEASTLLLALEDAKSHEEDGHWSPDDVVSFQRHFHAVFDSVNAKAKAAWGDNWEGL